MKIVGPMWYQVRKEMHQCELHCGQSIAGVGQLVGDLHRGHRPASSGNFFCKKKTRRVRLVLYQV